MENDDFSNDLLPTGMFPIDYSIDIQVAGRTKTVQMSWLTLNEETKQLQFGHQDTDTVISIDISDLFPDYQKEFLMTRFGKRKEKTWLLMDVRDNCLLIAQTTGSVLLGRTMILTEVTRYFCFDFRNKCRVFFNDVYNESGECTSIQIVRKEPTEENGGGRPKCQIIRSSLGIGGSGCDYYDSL